MVAATFPVNCQPSNGVLCDMERDLAASNVQRFFGSNRVTSAKFPRSSEPRSGRSNTFAGPDVKSSTMRVNGILCSRCSFVIANASAVSRPVIPNDARSNSTCFSWAACGAWSVAMASIVPSTSAATIASTIGYRAQWGIHLEVRVVLPDVLIDQHEVVRRHFAGHASLGALATAHSLQCIGGRDMRHMQPRFMNLLRERDVAIDHRGLRRCRHRAQSETEARRSRVHRTIFRDSSVFGVLDNRQVQFGAKTHGIAHHFVVENRLAIIRHGNRSGALQRCKIRQRRPTASSRRGCDGEYIDHGSALGMAQPSYPLCSIHHGSGVGHGANGSESTRGGRSRPAGDRLFVVLPRLAQVNVEIDKSRCNNQPARIEFFVGPAADFPRQRDLRHPSIPQQQIHRRIDLRRRIDHVPTLDEQASGFLAHRAFPSALARIAMRVATPL